MRTHPVDPREEKLPVWAQQRLQALRADLEYAGRRLAEGDTEDTRIWADPYADVPRAVGEVGDNIRFVLPSGEVTIQLQEQGTLQIVCVGKRGSDSLVVQPRAANVVTVGIEERA